METAIVTKNRARRVADFVILLTGIVCLGIAGWSLFKLTLDSSNLVRLTVFVAFPTLVGLAFLGVLPFSKSARLSLFLCLGSVFVAFYAFEAWLHFQYIQSGEKIKTALEKKTGFAYDRRTRAEVIADMRRQGKPAFPNNPNMFMPRPQEESAAIWPLANRSNALIVVGNESGRYFIPPSDRYGLTNPDSVYDLKSTGAVVVGDSFAQGLGVENHIARQMSRVVPRTVNLGMVGAGPGLQYALLKEYLPVIRPRYVFWIYFENDLSDFFDEMRHPVLRKYIQDPSFTQNLPARQKEIDAMIDAFMVDFEHKRAASLITWKPASLSDFLLLRQTRQRFNLNLSGPRRQGNDLETIASVLPEFKRILGTTRKMVEDFGGKLAFVYLPGSIHFLPGSYTEREDYTLRPQVLEIVKGLGIPVLDVLAAFKRDPDPQVHYFWYAGSHYNEQGYGVVANLILDYIRRDSPRIAN